MKLLLWLCLFSFATFAEDPIRGFPEGRLGRQRELERKALAIPEPSRSRVYMQRMSGVPHHAGSAGSRAVAEYALGLFREWGLNARIEEFEALLPYPTGRSLEMVSPVKFRARLQEPVLGEDSDSGDAGQLPTYNAYSASGDVTAPLVYVNYGIPEDYAVLKKLGIDVKGRIVIARYGRSWRGTKAKVAQEHGAVGCLIYSDPRDDGYFQGDVYPKGAFRPSQGVQRGSVMDMPLYVGDPLSPGWASEKGSRRLTREEAGTLMKIPVLPISYGDAQPLLENLGGPVPPEAWRGALPITYHIGPGPATARLKVDFDWSTRPLHNVVATIPGALFPDEWIVYGNHHDAWVNGASDPISGAAALLETGRTLAELRRQGWQPSRTIVLALWDGEEFGLVGSTEWAEKHRDELTAKAVAYLNTDSNSAGSFRAGGSPTLKEFTRELLRDLKDPVSGKSLLEGSRPPREESAARGGEFRLGSLGAGSDYVAFVHHLGIASMNLGFSGSEGGIYHSIYDSFAWYTKFSDKDFVYSKALAQAMTTMILRLSEATVLPFEFPSLATAVRGYIDDTRKAAGADAAKIDFSAAETALKELSAKAAEYETQFKNKLNVAAALSPDRLRAWNRLLSHAERALTRPEGLPGRPWYKHQLYAPGLYTGYSAKSIPGVLEPVEASRWEEASRQAVVLAATLQALSSHLTELTRLVQ